MIVEDAAALARLVALERALRAARDDVRDALDLATALAELRTLPAPLAT